MFTFESCQGAGAGPTHEPCGPCWPICSFLSSNYQNEPCPSLVRELADSPKRQTGDTVVLVANLFVVKAFIVLGARMS